MVSDEKEKAWIVAYNFVNITPGNKSGALREFYKGKGESIPKDINRKAWQYFKAHEDELNTLIEEFRADNRKEYVHMRDENIAVLKDVIDTGNQKDKVAAVKELNLMFGYNNQNFTLDGKVDSEIVVEIEGI